MTNYSNLYFSCAEECTRCWAIPKEGVKFRECDDCGFRFCGLCEPNHDCPTMCEHCFM